MATECGKPLRSQVANTARPPPPAAAQLVMNVQYLGWRFRNRARVRWREDEDDEPARGLRRTVRRNATARPVRSPSHAGRPELPSSGCRHQRPGHTPSVM